MQKNILFSIGARVPKAYSTCKMGSHCPATMEVIESDEINVIYYKIHVGHEKDLKHLLLSKTDKEELSSKLFCFFSRHNAAISTLYNEQF